MGTFHSDRGELHGITVVVETAGPVVYVGRCDTMDDETILLLDADEHDENESGISKAQYLEKAARFGVWKKHDRLAVSMRDVVSVTRLGER